MQLFQKVDRCSSFRTARVHYLQYPSVTSAYARKSSKGDAHQARVIYTITDIHLIQKTAPWGLGDRRASTARKVRSHALLADHDCLFTQVKVGDMAATCVGTYSSVK
jgi:hypothetical protein